MNDAFEPTTLLLSLLTPLNVIYYLIATSLIAFMAMGIDKMLAEAQRLRISERTLLTWAFIGGTPGAYAARHLFRHKTRKQPFSSTLHTIAALQMIALCAVFGWIYAA